MDNSIVSMYSFTDSPYDNETHRERGSTNRGYHRKHNCWNPLALGSGCRFVEGKKTSRLKGGSPKGPCFEWHGTACHWEKKCKVVCAFLHKSLKN